MPVTIADVVVEKVGDRVHVAFPYDPDSVEAVKSVGGGRWSKAQRAWTFPLDMETCRGLRRAFGDRLALGPEITAWARAEVARERALPTLAASEDAHLHALPLVAPRLAQALRPYQRVGVAFVREASRPGEGSLLADEPRTGKTLQAIAGVLDRGEAAHGLHLVVCPALSVDNVWQREVERWTDAPAYACVGKRAEREATIAAALADDAPVRFLIVNYEMVRYRERCLDLTCDGASKPSHTRDHKTVEEMDYPELFGQQYASLLVDESHKVFGSLRVNKGSQAGNGLKRLLVAENGIRLAITGTPFGKGGRVQGMFGTLHFLRPQVYTSFWRWAERHLEVGENDYGYKVVGGLKKDMDEESFFRSLGTVILRRTRREVMPWLGGKVYEDVYCEMTPKQATQYRRMEKEAIVDGMIADGVLAELTRLKQFANARHEVSAGDAQPTADSGKIAALLERLDEHGIGKDAAGDEKAIVFTQFERFARVVVDVLRSKGIETTTITGNVTGKARTAARDAFQQPGGPRVIVMTTQAGGVSITLDRASSVHMLDEMWNPEDNVQAEDRAVTTTEDGRKEPVAVYYYRSKDTIEEGIASQVANKAAEQHVVLDGRRGLDYVKRMKETA